MKKGLALFISFLLLITMSVSSCGDDDDDDTGEGEVGGASGAGGVGAGEDYGTPVIELGRYVSGCKASSEAGRSNKTLIDISANYIIINKSEYKYTGQLSCEDANTVSLLEVTYKYTKQGVFKGADLAKLDVVSAKLTPKTEEEAEKYRSIRKYDSTYWEIDISENITEEYIEEGAQKTRNGTSILIKSSQNILYVLPYTGDSTNNVLVSTEKYAKVNPSFTLGTYVGECEEANNNDHLAVITTLQITETEILMTDTRYSFEGYTPTCEEANKLYVFTGKISYIKKSVHRGGYAIQTNMVSASATIVNNDFLTTANTSDVDSLYNQHGWELNTPKDLTAAMQEAGVLSQSTITAKTVGNKLYISPYDDELSWDPMDEDGTVYTKVN